MIIREIQRRIKDIEQQLDEPTIAGTVLTLGLTARINELKSLAKYVREGRRKINAKSYKKHKA